MATATNTRVDGGSMRAPVLLASLPTTIVESLLYHLRRRGATLRSANRYLRARDAQGVSGSASGKRIHGDALLYAVGRHGNADRLRLPNAGLDADDRGRIAVTRTTRPPCRTFTPPAT